MTSIEPSDRDALDRAVWRKSTASNGNTCVEVADMGDRIALRNGNAPDGPVVFFTRPEIDAWIKGVKAGEFDDIT